LHRRPLGDPNDTSDPFHDRNNTVRRFAMFGIIVLAVLFAACQKGGQPAPTPPPGKSATTGAKQDSHPMLEIRNRRELDFEPGIKLTAWDFRAFRVAELTVRLLVIKDGKSQVVQELACKWENWPDSTSEAAWRLLYVLQDGDPFGAKNKRLPAITLAFDDAAPTSSTNKRSNQFVEGEFRLHHGASRKDGTLARSRPDIIYYHFYNATTDDSSTTLSGTVDSLVEASQGGHTAVAIAVEWKPFDGGK
jgi:hypothetical protein